MHLLPFHVTPRFLRVVFPLGIHCARVPVILLARQIRPAFNDENALTARREFPRERPSARPGPDDNEVVVVIAVHAGHLSRTRAIPYTALSRERRLPAAGENESGASCARSLVFSSPNAQLKM